MIGMIGEHLDDALDAAVRLSDDGVWVTKEGFVEGKRLVVIVAVGHGADQLSALMARVSVKDPRSTDGAKS